MSAQVRSSLTDRLFRYWPTITLDIILIILLIITIVQLQSLLDHFTAQASIALQEREAESSLILTVSNNQVRIQRDLENVVRGTQSLEQQIQLLRNDMRELKTQATIP